jgi:hypothetical protein
MSAAAARYGLPARRARAGIGCHACWYRSVAACLRWSGRRAPPPATSAFLWGTSLKRKAPRPHHGLRITSPPGTSLPKGATRYRAAPWWCFSLRLHRGRKPAGVPGCSGRQRSVGCAGRAMAFRGGGELRRFSGAAAQGRYVNWIDDVSPLDREGTFPVDSSYLTNSRGADIRDSLFPLASFGPAL